MAKIILLVVIAAAIASGIFLLNRKGGGNKNASPSPTASPNTSSKLIKEDIIIGTGAEAKTGSVITTHYVGTLENGVKFDSSYDRGEPIKFTLGVGQVIKGWDEGVLGMKVGGKRNLVIPPELGYGSQAIGQIPANSTIKFVVDLLRVD